MPLWVADERGLMRDGVSVGAPCAALDARDGVLWTAGERRGERVAETGAIESYPVPPGASRVRAGKHIYLLSADADCVTALDDDGRMAFSAPAGDFPRDLCVSGDGARLLVAGGASGEAVVMDDSLRVLREYALFGVVSAACFTSYGIAALCAVNADGLTTALVAARRRGVPEMVLTLTGAPCAICETANGDLLLGVTGEILRVRGKRILYRLPTPCPCSIRRVGQASLITDVCDGTVLYLDRPPGEIVYRGRAQDAIIV